MSRMIDKFFERDLVLKIISVIIGILIWFIVLEQQNPQEQRTVSVPLQTNREVLADKNISLVSSNVPSYVDVIVKGRKQRLDMVSSNDFHAFLDFSVIDDTSQNELVVTLPQYTGGQDIIVSNVYPRTVKIDLEKIIRKEFPIHINWLGELPEGYEVVNIKLSPNTVILQELESVVNSVKNVVVTAERDQLLRGNSINRRIEVYNQNDRNITSMEGSVQVNIEYDLAKTVPISTTVTGRPKEDYYVKDYTLSQNSVQIIGDYDLINEIMVIDAEQLNVENMDASFQEELKLQIPDKVQLYKSNNIITAQVNIEQFSYETVSIPKSSITIFGGDVSGKTRYWIEDDEITFRIKGPGEILNSVDLKSIKGFVSVSDISEEIETIEVQISLPTGVYMDESVFITIETEEVVSLESPTPTPEETSSSELEVEAEPTPVPEAEELSEP